MFDGTLDPATYPSPSGALSLHVDPSTRYGRGEADYRLERDDRELWSGRRPFTFFGAAVSDDGLVAGYSYAAGAAGGENDALSIVLLDATGATRWIERFERDGIVSCLGTTDPKVLDLWLDPPRDRLVVRVSRHGEFDGEEWWPFTLSTGAAGQRMRPRESTSSDERLRWIRAARPMPDSLLVLVHWTWSDAGAAHTGAVFTLQDLDGRVVWRLDWPQDYTVAGDEKAQSERMRELDRSGALLEVAADRFVLRSMASGERIAFGIEAPAEPSDGWNVRELSREPFAPPALEAATPRDVSTLQLLGTISLELDSPIAALALGPADRIYAVNDATGVIDVFDREGAWLFACTPKAKDLPEGVDNPTVSADEHGRVFLSTGQDEIATLVRFKPDGARLVARRLALDPFGQRAFVQPSGQRTWVVGSWSIHLLGSDGEPERKIERAPDGTWLRAVGEATLGPDGSLAVIASRGFYGPVYVAIYSATGEPRATIDVPQSSRPRMPLAFDGERIAFDADDANRLELVAFVDLAGVASMHSLPDAPEVRGLFYPRSARELWAFDGERTLNRYALP